MSEGRQYFPHLSESPGMPAHAPRNKGNAKTNIIFTILYCKLIFLYDTSPN